MDQLAGSVGADLAGVFARDNAHWWSLTLHGVTYSLRPRPPAVSQMQLPPFRTRRLPGKAGKGGCGLMSNPIDGGRSVLRRAQ